MADKAYAVLVDGEPQSPTPFASKFMAEVAAIALTAEFDIDPSRIKVKTVIVRTQGEK